MPFAVANIKEQNKNILIVEPSATAVLCKFPLKCLIFFFQGMFEVELCPRWYIENFRAHRHLFYIRTEGHWTLKYRIPSIKPLFLHFRKHRGVGRAEYRVQQIRNLYSLLQSQRAWNFASTQPGPLLPSAAVAQSSTQAVSSVHTLPGNGASIHTDQEPQHQLLPTVPALALSEKQHTLR